jgi:hypothetical protein
MSATVTGLQRMIDHANSYVSENGLSFNANKTKCVTYGKCHLDPQPSWNLSGNILPVCDSLDYLGATLSSNGTSGHKDKRIAACRGSYFALQKAGLQRCGVKPSIVAYLWNTAIQPALMYANESMALRSTQVLEMDKLQAKLIKNSLGFSKYIRSTALLNAMNVKRIVKLVPINSLKLFHSILNGSSRSRDLYLHMSRTAGTKDNNLFTRCSKFCSSHDISLLNITVSSQSCKSFCKSFLRQPSNDGLTDSVSILLRNFTSHDHDLVRLLLSPF